MRARNGGRRTPAGSRWRHLGDRLKALIRGESGAVIVEGEGGIGKSRLVETFVDQARALNVQVLVGAGDAIEKNAPYHAWRPVFARVFGLEEAGDDLAEWRERPIAHLRSNPEWDRLAPLATAVLPLELPDTELTGQMTGLVRADNSCDLLVSLLRAHMGTEPLVLILEDVHWFDSASWGLTRAAWRRLQPLLVVLATRPMGDTPPTEFKQIQDHDRTLGLKLEVLPPEDSRAVVANRLCVDDVPDAVVALIQDRAGGHPFFATELASALLETGAIAVEGRKCRIATTSGDLGDLKLPDTVQGVITSRVDRLPPAQQLTLKVASVIGRVFAYCILRDIHPIEGERPALPDHLTALERLDLTPLDTPEPDLSYLFKHVITQQVVYDLLLFAQRKEVHVAIAEWYERTHGDDLKPFFPLLAFHWERAGRREKALQFLELAANHALATGAFVEAIGFYRKYVEHSRNSGATPEADRLARAGWEHGQGQALHGIGELDEARRHGERAMALYGWRVPTSKPDLAVSTVREIAVQALHRLRADGFNGRLGAREADLKASQMQGWLGEIYYVKSAGLMGLWSLLRSLNVSEARGHATELAPALASAAAAGAVLGLSRAARHYNRLSIAALTDSEPKARYLGHRMVGVTAFLLGELTEAFKHIGLSLEQAESLGDWRFWTLTRTMIAALKDLRGDFGGAIEITRDVVERSRQEGWFHPLARGLEELGFCYLSLGRPDDCLAMIHERENLPGIVGARSADLVIAGMRGLACFKLGRRDEAMTAASSVVGIVSQPGWPVWIDYQGLVPAGETLIDLLQESSANDSKALTGAVSNLLGALKAFSQTHRFSVPAYLRLKGRAQALDGRPARAAESWRRGLAAATRMGMAYEEGLLRELLATT